MAAIAACSPAPTDAAAISSSESAKAAPSSLARATAPLKARTFGSSTANSLALPPVASVSKAITPCNPMAFNAASPLSYPQAAIIVVKSSPGLSKAEITALRLVVAIWVE